MKASVKDIEMIENRAKREQAENRKARRIVEKANRSVQSKLTNH
ncbi:MAG TPA: hypothetical protein VFK33_12900 [Bacillales bacterium]|nr:hypothetical protein [Bacillales bacterium]